MKCELCGKEIGTGIAICISIFQGGRGVKAVQGKELK